MSDELKIDPTKVVNFFGGISSTHRKLEFAGYRMSRKAVEKWVERGSIPTNRLAQLVVCARMDKRDFNLYEMVVGKTPHGVKYKKTKIK